MYKNHLEILIKFVNLINKGYKAIDLDNKRQMQEIINLGFNTAKNDPYLCPVLKDELIDFWDNIYRRSDYPTRTKNIINKIYHHPLSLEGNIIKSKL